MQRSRPELVGLWHGRMQLFGCCFSRLILNPSRAGFLVLGMVGMPSQKMRWHWALLQRGQASAGGPRSCCRELWLLQKDAFGKGEVLLFSAACQEAPLDVVVCGLAWQWEMGKVEWGSREQVGLCFVKARLAWGFDSFRTVICKANCSTS